jgi:hypothetical protein
VLTQDRRPVKDLSRSMANLSTLSSPRSCASRSTNPFLLLASTASPKSISASGSLVVDTHLKSTLSVKPSPSHLLRTTRNTLMSPPRMPSRPNLATTTEPCWLPITDVASPRSLEVGSATIMKWRMLLMSVIGPGARARYQKSYR